MASLLQHNMSSLPIPQTIINRRPSKLAATALEVARTQLGVMESPIGSQDGPQVRKYLATVDLGPGFAWCAAFVCWTYVQAHRNLGGAGLLPFSRTGGVMAMFNAAKGRNIQKLDAQDGPISPDALRPGDIFILQYPNGHAQAGIVEKISGDTIITIEGNTDANGGREGIGVFSKRRKVALLRGIIRVTE